MINLSGIGVLERHCATEFFITPWTLIPEGAKYRALQQVVMTILAIFVAFKTLCIPHVFVAIWIVKNGLDREVELKKLEKQFSQSLGFEKSSDNTRLMMVRSLGDALELEQGLSPYHHRFASLERDIKGPRNVFLLQREANFLDNLSISIPACFDSFRMEATTSKRLRIQQMKEELKSISHSLGIEIKKIRKELKAKQKCAIALSKKLMGTISDLQKKIDRASGFTGLLNALEVLKKERRVFEGKAESCFFEGGLALLGLQDVETRFKDLEEIFNGQLSARVYFSIEPLKAGNHHLKIETSLRNLQENPAQLLREYADKVKKAIFDGTDLSKLPLKIVLDDKVVKDQNATNREFLHRLFGSLKLDQGLFHGDCSLELSDMKSLGYVMRHIYENDNLLLGRDIIRESDLQLLLSYSQKELQEFQEVVSSIKDTQVFHKPLAIALRRFFANETYIMPRMLHRLALQISEEKKTQNILQMEFLGKCTDPEEYTDSIIEYAKDSSCYTQFTATPEEHRGVIRRCIYDNMSDLIGSVRKMEMFASGFNEFDYSQKELLGRNDGINWGPIMQDTLYARGWEDVSKRILKGEQKEVLAVASTE